MYEKELIYINRIILNNLGTFEVSHHTLSSNPFNGYTGKAARLLTYQEVLNGCNGYCYSSTFYEKCNGLLENTEFSRPSNSVFGYYLENPSDQQDNVVRIVDSTFYNIGYEPPVRSSYGIRSAIDVPITKIKY